MIRFDSARRAALMEDLVGFLLRRPLDLLPFDQVRERLRLRHLVDRGVQEVPLERIVGTIGREREFNRAFLPRVEALRDRWEGIKELAEGPLGFPPVELYQVGEAFFVLDGHHRVSVARALGAPTIEARVKEFLTPVPLESDTSVEELLLKRGLADFLETTGLVPEQPDEFRVTVANGYERLLDHINVHRYFLGIQAGRETSWSEAVESWRDTVYRPMLETIRRSEVLEEFPGRTESDLYLFTMDHLHHLRQRYASDTLSAERAVQHFSLLHRGRHRLREKLSAWWTRRMQRR
jgi:hypothetical protein